MVIKVIYFERNLLKLSDYGPTRLSNNGGAYIDCMYNTRLNPTYVLKSDLLNNLLPNHLPVYAVRKTGKEYMSQCMSAILGLYALHQFKSWINGFIDPESPDFDSNHAFQEP